MKRYTDAVNKIIVARSRIMIPVAIVLMMMAGYLDYITYPSRAPLFLAFRVACCTFLAALWAMTYSQKFEKHIIWITHLVVLALAGSIIFMLFLTNGARSHYYEGVNLVIIATLVMNSFYFKHGFGICLTLLILYTAACLANRPSWDAISYFFNVFFIFSTSVLVLVMTRLYKREHLRAFLSHAKMEELFSEADTLSKIDDLTQIFNRRYFMKILGDKIELSQETGIPFYLVFFDIDHFKEVNDRHGHTAGDRAIQAVVGQVRQAIRTSSQMGRYGGDEFMFFMDFTDRDAFLARMDQVREKVKNFSFTYEQKTIPLSVSFGAVFVDPQRYKKAQALIDVADQAMFEVKRSKRGGITLID